MNKFKDLVTFNQTVIENGIPAGQIILYCIPVKINRSESGYIENYEVLQIFEVEEHLLGNNPSTSKIRLFSPNSVPDRVSTQLHAKDQGLLRD